MPAPEIFALTAPEAFAAAHDALALARRAAPAHMSPLLAAALRPLCAAFHADFGMLLALDGETVVACAFYQNGEVWEDGADVAALLLTQGIAGYAVARGGPILLRDISADPRWGPPSLAAALPARGAALALVDGEMARLVLVLVAPEAAPFSMAAVAELEQVIRQTPGATGGME
jgi:hypothetical protein